MKKYLATVVSLIALYSFAEPASALTIAPTKVDLAGDPGQTVIAEIELFNEQNEAKTFYVSFENFEPRGETGAPFFVGSGNGLATWLTAQPSITLEPGERDTVPYTLSIPAGATPGGYFAAIFFGSQPLEDETGGGKVSIGGKVGSLMMLRVNGAISESGGLLDYQTEPKERFFSYLPINLSYRFNNTGGDRVIPRGEVVIKNTFGSQIATLDANKNEGSVLPASTRKFITEWGKSPSLPEGETELNFVSVVKHQFSNFHFGLYRTNLNISWGDSFQTATASYWIFILPWQLMLVSFLALLVVYFIVRKYNSYIISRSKRS